MAVKKYPLAHYEAFVGISLAMHWPHDTVAQGTRLHYGSAWSSFWLHYWRFYLSSMGYRLALEGVAYCGSR